MCAGVVKGSKEVGEGEDTFDRRSRLPRSLWTPLLMMRGMGPKGPSSECR